MWGKSRRTSYKRNGSELLGGNEQNFTCWRREGTKNSIVKGTNKQAEAV